METKCPFCALSKERIWFESKHSLAFLDGFPITEGHTLVIPKRHVSSVFELEQEELNDLALVVGKARKVLQKKFKPDAFNIGVNDGAVRLAKRGSVILLGSLRFDTAFAIKHCQA